ncbi:NADPH:quinone reductase [Amycolatopsis sp. FDAARGOS 1241]|uniref:NADPH:quinone reductase n=1 Tax=Amycolatopsis sp. FDAARGOS 1241 TaxID=2778070 RepID=UPI00194F9B20|nr:NADPH:quinone reductase [Amycolatopsis sp. FDAARGOS 1241]QRP43311.1 NADPH:quinone reductase [Amycolatopsis sp. FDAARGOS 1241]
MRAVTYSRHGGPEVLSVVERDLVEPGAGEVRVRVVVSAVNPTDWKQRRGPGELTGPAVPNQDGAGVVDAVGPGVTEVAVGDRVWVILAAAHSPASGTAQEYTVLPASRVVRLPDDVGFDEGAAFAIPALTAHRALTVAEDGPARLGPAALAGRTVLVTGGAGAVGNAAIQLARWAGATVLTTVSTDEKAALARAAGADQVLSYTAADPATEIKALAPEGVDLVVEVAAGVNAGLHLEVLRPRGTVAAYGDDRGTGTLTLDFRRHLWLNTRYQFLVLYTVGLDKLRAGAEDVTAALRAGALRLGDSRGLPVHRFPLAETARAHEASEQGITGKVLIDVTPAS